MNTSARSWRDWRWDLWARVYDPVVRGLATGRRVSIDLAEIRPGERILLSGAGTGLDLPLLPPAARITAIEQSPAMIAKLRLRAERHGLDVEVIEGDAGRTGLEAGSFDAVLLHLILAVADSPEAILAEAGRLLRPGGRIVVFDKFAADKREASLARRVLNRVTRPLATDVTLQLESLASGAGMRVVKRKPAGFGGFFQAAVLNKIQD